MKKQAISIVKLVLLLFVASPTNRAASYTIFVPPWEGEGTGKFFAGYHFTTNTISSIFPPLTLPWGTQIQIWDNSTQSFVTQTLDDIDEDWYPNPNYLLKPGDVFFIQNVTEEELEITVSGTEITGTKTLNLYTNIWNGYTAVKLPPAGAMLECVPGCEFGAGMGYGGHNGDYFIYWDPTFQDWASGTRTETFEGSSFSWGGTCDGGVAGKGHQATQPQWLGWGALFLPVQNTTWTFSITNCGE